MGLFNFNKKKKFLSKLSSDQRDEITITLILMKQMIDADGVDKPEEKEYYKKYLINCGISSKEELEFILDRAGNLTSDQYDTIVHDFDEFQKLTILQELYGIICSDNEINQDELDLLFHISRDMGIDDDIIVDMLGAKGDLLEKFNESRSDSKSISNLDKFCSECGNQFESDQKFCPNCGNKRNIAELDEGELKDKVETDQENKQKIIEEAKAIIVSSNKNLRDELNKFNLSETNSFRVDILFDKWSFFEEINYAGNFKGFDFTLNGGTAIKWSKHKGCYKNELDGFLNDIKNKDISELDFQSLNYDCEDSDEDYDYNFFNKIVWDENTPEEIIKDVEKNYSKNEYEKLRDEVELEEEFLDIELFQKKGFISEINISISFKNKIKNLKWVKDENIQDTIDNEESKFSFNKVQALRQIELNWIKGISPIYSVSLIELFKHPGRTLCFYNTDEESDFYEGEHISIIVKSISEGKDLIDFITTQNGENVSFLSIDNDRIIHKLGYLFDISLVEPEDFDFPIVEINRRKKLDYTSARGEEILHGIHVKSDSIKSKIKGFKKLILNNGELVADGRYTSDSDAQKIDSWHSDFSTAFDDVNQVLEANDPANEFLKLNIEEAKNKIIDSGFSYKAENFEMNFYKGNSSWWINFNLN